MESCTACEPWTAHKAQRLGLLTQIVPALKVDGKYVEGFRYYKGFPDSMGK